MTFAQPIITAFNQIPPGDTITIPAKTAVGWATAVSWLAERAPLYNSATMTANPSPAVWVATNGTDASTADGSSAKPYATIVKAAAVVNSGSTEKWIILKSGTYRQSYSAASFAAGSKVLGISGEKGGQVWIDGSKVIASAATGSGPYTITASCTPTFHTPPDSKGNPTWSPLQDIVFLDGVPQVRVTTTPTAGQFSLTAAGVLKLGSNPSGKTVEYIDLGSPHGAIAKNGFTYQYLGIRRFAGQFVQFVGDSQKLDHFVGAYTNAPDGKSALITSSATNPKFIETVFTHCGAKTWASSGGGGSTGFVPRASGMRIDSGNWLHDYDVRPGNRASLGGSKFTSTHSVWDDNIMYRNNQSNGEWYDIQCKNTRTTRFYFGGNAGYGGTKEVGQNVQMADGIVVGNGFLGAGNNHGFRISGDAQPQVYNVTSVNNYGANFHIDEDARQYAGIENGCRQLDGHTSGHDHTGAATGHTAPGNGDNFGLELRGNVFLKGPHNANANVDGTQGGGSTILQDPAFPGWGVENQHNGFLQTRPISTKEALSDDINAGTLTFSASGPNVFINIKDNGKSIRWLTPQAGSKLVLTFLAGHADHVKASATTGYSNATLYSVADIHSNVSASLEVGSLDVGVAGESFGKYFPNAGDTTAIYTWWGVAGGLIPGTTTSIPTFTPPDWVADALGTTHGVPVKVGCHRAPVPVALGTATGSNPDIATLTTPADGAPISGSSVSVSAEGHDPDDGTNVTVELRADGQSLSTPLFLTHTTGNTFTGTLNTTLLSDGDHDLRARVTDTAGNFLASSKNTVTVNNGADTTPPTVTGLNLSDGDRITNPKLVSASVTDASGVQSATLVVTGDDGTVYKFTMS